MDRSETNMFEGEAGLRALCASARMAMMVVGANGKVELTNSFANTLFGSSAEELVGQPIDRLIPGNLIPKSQSYLQHRFDSDFTSLSPETNLQTEKKEDTEFPGDVSLGCYNVRGEQVAIAFVKGRKEENANENQQAHEALRKSEAIYTGIFENSLAAIVIHDSRSFKIIDVNEVATKLFGYKTKEEFINTYDTLKHYLNPADRTRIRKISLAEGQIRNETLAMKKLDGSVMYCKLFSRGISGTSNLVTVLTDVTNEVLQFEALKQNREHYRMMFESIREVFVVMQPITDEAGNFLDARFLEVNPAAEKALGKTSKELVGRLRSEVIGPYGESRIKYYNQILRGNEAVAEELFFPISGRWIESRTYPYDKKIISVGFDITDRKVAEKKLEEESNWQQFLASAINRLWRISNIKDGLEEILSTSVKLLNTTKGKVQLLDRQKHVLKIAAHNGLSKAFLEHFAEINADTESVCSTAFIERKQIIAEDVQNDPRYSSHAQVFKDEDIRAIQAMPLYDLKGEPIGMICTQFRTGGHFTTEGLKRIEMYARYAESFLERMWDQDTLKEMNLELEDKVQERTLELTHLLEHEKELNESKSRFVSFASHEFRTPLSTILSSISLIESYHNDEQKRKKHIARAKSSIKNMIDLLNDFLSLDKLSQGKIEVTNEDIDLHEFALDIVEEMNHQLKPGQSIDFTYTGGNKIQRDKKILKNVLLNLLSNAIKYSGEGKHIGLLIDVGDVVSITVKDEGIGISEEDQKNLFEKFFRAQNATNVQGTGLGLNIVKKYVELLDGKINFVSTLNVGSTFTVAFPAK